MAHIALADAQAWLENTKCNLDKLDPALEQQIAADFLGQLSETYGSSVFGVPTWVDFNTTPELVKSAIAMTYAGWFYDRQYSEVIDANGTSYGSMLRGEALALIAGIISGAIELVETQPNEAETATIFYPTDASSTTDALLANSNPDDMSLGPPMFGMQKVF